MDRTNGLRVTIGARHGVWDGARILPVGRADTARTIRAYDEEGNANASHWWGWPDGVFAAQGYETQRILVDPEADVVIVRLGKTPDRADAVDAWLCDLLACVGRSRAVLDHPRPVGATGRAAATLTCAS